MQLRISLTVSQILVESTDAWRGKVTLGGALPLLVLPTKSAYMISSISVLLLAFRVGAGIVRQGEL